MSKRIPTIIVYGSYGYTGKLIVNECKEKNIAVLLSGRNDEALRKQSAETGYPFEVVEIDDAVKLRSLLRKGKVVIHCGGPFQYTSRQMANACLETNTHYTDITGEHEVFEMLAGYDDKAKQAGIMIMPGTGFDVVPSDCLALHLKNRLPSATHLQLAFTMSKGGMSRGTLRTTIEGLGKGSMIRRNGKLVHIPLGEKVMDVNFGSHTMKAMNIPWGDVSTAWYSTGIPNIEVYIGATNKMIVAARMSKYFTWLLKKRGVKNYFKKKIDQGEAGPSEEKRKSGKSFLWGKVWNDAGEECSSTLVTLSGYAVTAKMSVLIATKILNDDHKVGFQTPAMAYGPDLIVGLENTQRKDV